MSKCWYCGKKERKDDDSLFCEDCEDPEVRDDKGSGTLIIYDKI